MNTSKTNWAFQHGIGIGGWLTNYKYIVDLPDEWKYRLTKGDFEHFRTFITENDVQYIASLGLDHVRMCFDQFVLEESPFKYREEIFQLLDNFIGWCEKYHLGVILNLHRAYGNAHDEPQPKVHMVDDPDLQSRFIDLWLACEKRWHDKPDVVFEPMNEPVNVDPEKWNDLTERAVQTLRKFNPTRRIVVTGTCWSLPCNLMKMRIYDDPNVIYTFHFYAPHIFTHQRAPRMPSQRFYNRRVPYPGGLEEYYRDFNRVVNNTPDGGFPGLQEMDIDFLRREMQPALAFRKAHPDKVLWLGEFGTIGFADQISRENWMHDVICIAKENGIPFCSWNYYCESNTNFGLTDAVTRRILSPELGRIIAGKVRRYRTDY